jgi:8-oxo-dGTP diphosphatase
MTILKRNAKNKNPIPAVDFLIPKDDDSKILLVRRKNAPFKGMLSVPGGFINEGETAEDAMRREAKEETSLFLEPIAILGVYSDPHRDPRMHTLSVTFATKISQGNEAAGDDAADLQWISVEEELDGLIKTGHIAFDHSKILSDYKSWIKAATISPINSRPTFWSTKKRESSREALRNKASDYG